MRRLLIPILLIVSLSLTAYAGENGPSYVDVTVEYSSQFPGYVQIKDEECASSVSIDCEKARLRLQRDDCRRERPSQGCRDAQEILENSSCIPGLIYEGAVSKGDSFTASVCKSSGGFGTIAVRNLRNGNIWTRYFLVSDGNVIRYP